MPCCRDDLTNEGTKNRFLGGLIEELVHCSTIYWAPRGRLRRCENALIHQVLAVEPSSTRSQDRGESCYRMETRICRRLDLLCVVGRVRDPL